jgi:hypothetical protein
VPGRIQPVTTVQGPVAWHARPTTGRALGNESRGGAHPNSARIDGAVGRRGTVAFDGGGAGTVVAVDAAQVMHHGERERRVRWGSRRPEEVRASGSPSG